MRLCLNNIINKTSKTNRSVVSCQCIGADVESVVGVEYLFGRYLLPTPGGWVGGGVVGGGCVESEGNGGCLVETDGGWVMACVVQ